MPLSALIPHLKRRRPARATLEKYRPSVWRRGWDSNPRYPFGVHSISSAAPSAARSPLQLGLILLGPDRKVKLEWGIVQSVAVNQPGQWSLREPAGDCPAGALDKL